MSDRTGSTGWYGSKTIRTCRSTRAMPGFLRICKLRLRAGGAALLATPRLLTFAEAHRRDRQRDSRIKPPQTKQGIRREADEHRRRENGAQHILRPLAVSGTRPQLFADPLFGAAKPRAQHQGTGSERDAEP